LEQAVSPAGTACSRFDGVSLRLVMWQYAFDILHERKAWLFGVSAGDSQELLDQKYLDAGMSEGYLGYNFHNQYIEVLVRSGLFGAAVFMAGIILLIGLVRAAATPTAAFTLAMILVLFLTESALEMQHTLFLFAFFPILIASPQRSSSDR
jgi:O-antigen ligase